MARVEPFILYVDQLRDGRPASSGIVSAETLPSALIIETIHRMRVGEVRERLWAEFRSIFEDAGRLPFAFDDVQAETLDVDSEGPGDETDRYFLIEINPVDQLADDVAHGHALIELAEWLEQNVDWIASAHADLTLMLDPQLSAGPAAEVAGASAR